MIVRRVWPELLMAALLVSCRSEPPSGELMLVLDGAIKIPAEIDWVHVDVRAGGKLVHSGDYRLGPNDYAFPSTLGLVAGESGNRAVAVRVLGRSGGASGRVRVLREARTQIPENRVAALPLNLTSKCLDFVVDATSAETASSCGEGRTCIEGGCGSIDFAPSRLQDFTPTVAYPESDGSIEVRPTSGLVTREDGTQASFTVRLGVKPTANVVVPIETSRPTEGTVSVRELVFTPETWSALQTVDVVGIDDAAIDGDAPYDVIVGAAVSSDARFAGLDPPDVHVRNIDDELPPGVALSPVTVPVTTEAGGTAKFDVRLQKKPSANVTFTVATSDPTEGTSSLSSIVFTPQSWNVPQSVVVTGVDDFVADGDVPYRVVTGPVFSLDPAYAGIDPADVDLVNLDRCAVAGPVPGGARALSPPLRDDFGGASLQATKWTTSTALPRAGARIAQIGGRVEIQNGAHLVSARQFDAAVAPVRITGSWTVAGAVPDSIAILTRSDGVPDAATGATRSGLECTLSSRGKLEIAARPFAVLASVDAFVAAAGQRYAFELYDDGASLTCTVRRDGGQSATVKAVSSMRTGASHVVFHNGGEANNPALLAQLDDVQIEHGLRRPSNQWGFDEPSGSTAIDLIGSAHGAFGASVTHSVGILGGSVSLPGTTSSIISFGTSAGQFGRADFSVSLWFKAPANGRTSEIFGNRDSAFHSNFFELTLEGGGRFRAELDEDGNGKNNAITEAPGGLDDNVWHHALSRRTGRLLDVFIDGRPAASVASADVTNNVNGWPLRLGQAPFSEAYGRIYKGEIDDLRIYAYPLSQCEASVLVAR